MHFHAFSLCRAQRSIYDTPAMRRIGTLRLLGSHTLVLVMSLVLATGCRKYKNHRRELAKIQFAKTCFATTKAAPMSQQSDPMPYANETSWFPIGTFSPPHESYRNLPRGMPMDWLTNASKWDAMTRESFEGELAKMREPSLSRPPPGIEKAFRLVVNPSLGELEIKLARVMKTKGGAFLVAMGGGNSKRTVRRLSPGQWSCLESMVDSADFWRVAPVVHDVGLDCPSLFLEGVSGSQYHAVTRNCWSPVDKSYNSDYRFSSLCSYLARLAGLYK